MLRAQTVSLQEVFLTASSIYWIEERPEDGGRCVIVERRPNGVIVDRIPAPYDASSRVHEYGGGAFTVSGETVFFCDGGDGRIYRQDPGQPPRPVTPADALTRYADLIVDTTRERLIAVREVRDANGLIEHAVVAIPIVERDPMGEILFGGHDFFMFPRLSPDGTRLAVVAWDQPHMPWDSSYLLVATLRDDGGVNALQSVAGGEQESIFQPEWSPDNQLYFVSDRTGWWNLYSWQDREVRPVTALHAEFGEAAWTFGLSTYGFVSATEILASYTFSGLARLVRINVATREMSHLACPFSTISHVKVLGDHVLMIAGADRSPKAIVSYDADHRQFAIVRTSVPLIMDEDDVSLPESLEFPTTDGTIAFGYYYAPKNRDYIAPEGESPPLVVMVHGGPTDRCEPVFQLDIQYWTTRGFAVMDVNYGGSTGYGRPYRDRLRGHWGIVDVDDAIAATIFLSRHNKADPRRAVIRGTGAGGFTALAAVAFRNTFRAATTYNAISDLAALARATHHFESHYLDGLIGPLPSHEALYQERSPVFHLDRLRAPVLAFHGLQDRVIPVSQTQALVESLTQKGLPVGTVTFAEEGHEFSHPDTMARCYEAELAFYAKVLNIRLPERVEAVSIQNCPE
ncbi:MAG: peptidase [Sulfobacillus acidophilus]|uniref:Peptidase n=1 Tax=Sulfobacillus acidophilus TaxID=53633 RepID=A0A2T2WCY1_9FIRM|nr:MAG: peptidase [Sulfobacillus acidophilus]